jgi:hypothetical protein
MNSIKEKLIYRKYVKKIKNKDIRNIQGYIYSKYINIEKVKKVGLIYQKLMI